MDTTGPLYDPWGTELLLAIVLILLEMLVNHVYDLGGVRAYACVKIFKGAGVNILLLALRGKTTHGGGYSSRSPSLSTTTTTHL